MDDKFYDILGRFAALTSKPATKTLQGSKIIAESKQASLAALSERYDLHNESWRDSYTCSDCGGTGQDDSDSEDQCCKSCDGTGMSTPQTQDDMPGIQDDMPGAFDHNADHDVDETLDGGWMESNKMNKLKLLALENQLAGLKKIAEGKTVFTPTGRVHHGDYGTEYQGDEDEELDGKKAKKAAHKAKVNAGEKRGRGRPKKERPPEMTKLNDPFGMKKGDDPYKAGKAPKIPKGAKVTKHKMAGESRDLSENMFNLERQLNRKLMKESGPMVFDHIMDTFKADIKAFQMDGDLSEHLYDALYDYYLSAGEMPYGVAKARDGDPREWISDRLEQDLGSHVVDEVALDKTHPDFPPALAGGPRDVDVLRAHMGKQPPLVKPMDPQQDLDHPTVFRRSKELDELAKLAGLPVLDEDTCENCGCKPCECMDEGNQFSGALAAARAQHRDSFDVDGKSYPVREGEYGDTKIKQPPRHANQPDPVTQDEDVLLKGGDGEVAGKEKVMRRGGYKFGDNPMAMENVLGKLDRMISSIKR